MSEAINKEELRWAIGRLQVIPAYRFAMKNWMIGEGEHACGTVGCIGGWLEVLEKERRGTQEGPVAWLGGSSEFWNDVFNMSRCEFSLIMFDSQNPPDVRKAAMIDVLQQIVDTGNFSWRSAGLHTGAVLINYP